MVIFFIEKNIDFLNYMYKNAKMGIIGIDDVYPKAKSKEMKELLQKKKNKVGYSTNEKSNRPSNIEDMILRNIIQEIIRFAY